MAAALSTSWSKLFRLLLVISFLHVSFVNSTEFLVGGEDGWVTPKSKNDRDTYNEWASKKRFKVNDTLCFKYEKDSVMVVMSTEYEKCRSSHPLFFSNDGNTTFRFDRSGLFYFISGVAGHCERGERMIIKVLELETPPPQQSENQNSTDASERNGAAVHAAAALLAPCLSIVSLFWVFIHI